MAAIDHLDGDGYPELFVAGIGGGDDGIAWRVALRDIRQLQQR